MSVKTIIEYWDEVGGIWVSITRGIRIDDKVAKGWVIAQITHYATQEIEGVTHWRIATLRQPQDGAE
jgi:hypothetical protein